MDITVSGIETKIFIHPTWTVLKSFNIRKIGRFLKLLLNVRKVLRTQMNQVPKIRLIMPSTNLGMTGSQTHIFIQKKCNSKISVILSSLSQFSMEQFLLLLRDPLSQIFRAILSLRDKIILKILRTNYYSNNRLNRSTPLANLQREVPIPCLIISRKAVPRRDSPPLYPTQGNR